MASKAGVKPAPPVPSNVIQLEDGWAKVNEFGIQKLQRIIQSKMTQGDFTNKEYVTLYTIIYTMCIQKQPHCYTPQLYRRFEESIVDYLKSTVLPSLTSSESGAVLVSSFVHAWNDHRVMTKWMVDFFRYLDRFYVKRHSQRVLDDVALFCFYKEIYEKIKGRVTKCVIDLIQRDREGDAVDRSIIRDALNIYTTMHRIVPDQKTYANDFERDFLSTTLAYYSRLASTWMENDNLNDYFIRVDARYTQERQRISDYLNASTETALFDILNKTLLIQHQKTLFDREPGITVMLQNKRYDDIARIFHLYKHVPQHLQPLANIVTEFIMSMGKQLVEKSMGASTTTTAKSEDGDEKAEKKEQSSTVSSSYIDELMKLHDECYELVKTCFDSHALFQKSLKDSFEFIVNKANASATATPASSATPSSTTSSTAELLATYSDNLLKKGGTMTVTEKQLELTLDNIVRLFSYLSDKDLFSEFYRKFLSARLLTQRSASTDAEKSMIGKLKLKCGAQFTSKLEGMINDMRMAIEQQSDFQAFLTNRMIDLNNIEFSVQTLTSGFWPTYPIDEIKLNTQMQKCIDTFRVYYDTKTNNRCIKWLHDLGVVHVNASFKTKHELVGSTIQACILLLFNTQNEYTIDMIGKLVNLPADVLKSQLKSLILGKVNLLVKKPANGYNVTDVLRVNAAFTSQQRRVRIATANRGATSKDRDGAAKAVSEDRRHAIEATIVRIMKSRKTLQHSQLIAEVSQQLITFFQPDPRTIKQRIEDLIVREYLERDQEKNNVYHYLA